MGGEVVVAGSSSSTESELLIPCGQGDPEDDDAVYSDISSTDLPEFDSDEEEEAAAPVPVPVPAPAPAAVRSTFNPPSGSQSRRQTERPRSASAVYDEAVVVGRGGGAYSEANPRFYELVPVSHLAL